MRVSKYYRVIAIGEALFLSLALMIAPARVHALDLHVTDASLEAHPMNYSGPCPGVIKFKGKITADAPGTVKYTFTRSDGATGPVYRLDFVTAGTQEVETVWTLGDSSVLPHYEGWQTIKILAKRRLMAWRSTRASSRGLTVHS